MYSAEPNVELLRVLSDAIRCENTEVIDAIMADLALPLDAHTFSRLFARVCVATNPARAREITHTLAELLNPDTSQPGYCFLHHGRVLRHVADLPLPPAVAARVLARALRNIAEHEHETEETSS